MSRSERLRLALFGAAALISAAAPRGASAAEPPRDGFRHKWSAEGRLLEVRFYQDGRKEGEHLGWWPDGTPRFRYHFSRGKYEGEQIAWTRSGRMATLNHYRAGREEGLQRAWTGDGVMTFNYTVKDGRIYGYRGTRECGRKKKP